MATEKKRKEFINREVSWLSFNERVLQEAQDTSVPLIERFRFLGIFSNNLDEFFRVRVATLHRAKRMKTKSIDPMDFNPEKNLLEINTIVQQQQKKFDLTFKALSKELATHKIDFVDETQLSKEQKTFVENYFEQNVRPLLVPIMLNNKLPFPALSDTGIYLAITLGYKAKAGKHYALIEVPSILPRFIEIPAEKNKQAVIFLDDIIRYRLRKVFGIYQFDTAHAYTIKTTRDAELDIDDDLSKSLVDKMSRSLNQRKKGEYVRLTIDEKMPADLLDFILKKIKIKDKENIILGGRYHNKKDLMKFPNFGKPELCFTPMKGVTHPRFMDKKSLLEEIQKQDVLLHYPYQSFVNLLDIIREAAIDPEVRTIRISIYRLAKDSQILNALINALRNGKRVIAVIEVQARFDEFNNIEAVKTLQEHGAKVIPGVQGLKVHSKLILISKKMGAKTTRYAHIGSGNFHEGTAHVYTDLSLWTANREIVREVRKVFEFFENNYIRHTFRHLLLSPFSMRRKCMELIAEEIENARKKKPAYITIKMNNLVDMGMIKKLYEASSAGVKIKLIIRGICSLVPGVKGLSENIQVISIVGRFLEHSRVFVFCNNNKPLYYISSADWMTRNLDHRVEVTTPVYDPVIQKELQWILDIQLDPKAKARSLNKELNNEYVFKGTQATDTQKQLIDYYQRQQPNR